jgi:hypothetical protein
MEEQQTEFNSNKATLIRLDRWLRYAAEAQFNGSLDEYFKHLKNVRKEVAVKMKRDSEKASSEKSDKEKAKQWFDDQEEQYQELKRVSVQHENSPESFKNEFEKKLEDYEFLLRTYADKKGMLLRETDSAGL